MQRSLGVKCWVCGQFKGEEEEHVVLNMRLHSRDKIVFISFATFNFQGDVVA